MAYLTVTTQADVVDAGDGKLSLREAVAQANASASADTIRFIAALEGKTLVLTGGELVVTQDLTIDGGDEQITIDGNLNGRILNIVGAGTDVRLRQVTLANGRAHDQENGGAILLGGGSLTVSTSTIRDSRTERNDYSGAKGGGIFATDGSRLALVDSTVSGNYGFFGGGGIATGKNVALTVESCVLSGNTAYSGGGGALFIQESNAVVTRSSIHDNRSNSGGAGIDLSKSNLSLSDSTVANNSGVWEFDDIHPGGSGVKISGQSTASVSNSTITGNMFRNFFYAALGGGILVDSTSRLAVANSIVAGNSTRSDYKSASDPDITGTVAQSNGHNLFGSDVKGAIVGDRKSVPSANLFATIDPTTGGGQLSPKGIVPLKNAATNPALSAADPITAGSFGQLGTTKRPLPAGSLPDIGSIEISQPLSTSPTANNDVITGSSAANNLSGLAGNDYLKGLGGTDTLNGNDGSDVLDGGPGNDRLNGGNGVDIATFAGTTAVVVDLSANPGTAKRGGETDTLTSIEGAIGSDKADSFKGDGQDNEFQGGLGKDSYTGGGGRDLYAFKTVQDSPAGAGRDVIKDFVPGQYVIDVSDLDADSTTPGQQSFRWVGKATLTGAAQLGYYVSGGNTIVRASTDADGKAEVEIQLNGTKTLTAGDFRF